MTIEERLDSIEDSLGIENRSDREMSIRERLSTIEFYLAVAQLCEAVDAQSAKHV